MTRILYVDASELLNRRLTGIQRYTVRVIHRLAQMTPIRLVTPLPWSLAALRIGRPTRLVAGQEIELNPDNVPPSDLDAKAWRRQVIRFPNRPIDRAAQRDAACLVPWCPEYLDRFGRLIAVIHDMTPLVLPRTVGPEMYALFGGYCERDLPRIDCVLAVSQATKTDVAWLAGIEPSRIVVALSGPSQCVDGHGFGGKCRRESKRLLVVGANHPRKNMQFLIDWFMTSDVLPEDAELWWAGQRNHSLNRAHASSHKHKRRLRLLGDVPDATLCRLYQETGCTVSPTLYEGFGFPVLDSLLHGTPVLCSCNSALTEFSGPGVFFFDPCDAATLDRAWQDYHSAWPFHIHRDDLRETCRWDNVAQTVLRLCA